MLTRQAPDELNARVRADWLCMDTPVTGLARPALLTLTGLRRCDDLTEVAAT